MTIIDVGGLEAAETLKIMDNTYPRLRIPTRWRLCIAGVDMVAIVRAANQGYNRNSIRA